MATAQQGPELYSRNGLDTAEARRQQQVTKAERARKLQTLEMQREHILSQRTSNPGRRSALEAALKQIEDAIQALG